MKVAEGYKDTKIGRIPKDWEVVKLSEVADILNNKRKPLNSSQRNSISGDVPYYGANGQVDSINDFIFNEPLILMAEDGGNFSDYEFRHIAYKITGKSWVNNHAHVLKPKSDFDFDYIFYELEHKNILRFINGSTRTKLNQGDLKGIPLKIPPLPEQQKIAEILSTVDEQISTTQAIIDKSKKLKKGLMQKLFSEGIGHTELKDTKIGRIPKDWEVVKLNDYVLKVGSGVTPKGGSSVYLKEGIPLLRSQNVLYGKLYLDDVACIGEPQYQKMKNSQLQEHDVLLNISGASIGRSAVVPQHILPANVNQHVCIIRAKDLIYSNYLCSFLLSREGQNQIFRLQAGGNREGLNFQQIRSFKIPLPPFTEQQKIAEILSEADAKIEKEELEKTKFEELKKGLMQQLLTGKKRVKV